MHMKVNSSPFGVEVIYDTQNRNWLTKWLIFKINIYEITLKQTEMFRKHNDMFRRTERHVLYTPRGGLVFMENQYTVYHFTVTFNNSN